MYVVGGHINHGNLDKGNVFTVHSNEYTEMNMYLDPSAAKTVLESSLDIKLIPLNAQRKASSFSEILQRLGKTNRTPEALFAHRLLSRLYRLQQTHYRYHHMVKYYNLKTSLSSSFRTIHEIVQSQKRSLTYIFLAFLLDIILQDTFLGEILGAVVLAGGSLLNPILQIKPIKVLADGVESKDGQTVVDEKQGKLVKILETVDPVAYYDTFANQMGVTKQSAVIGSFEEQRRIWTGTGMNSLFRPLKKWGGENLDIFFSIVIFLILIYHYII